MIKKIFIAAFFYLFLLIFSLQSSLFAWTNCPPADLAPNPRPIIVEGKKSSSCIVEADWVELKLNESWSRKINLTGGKTYWFSASKCARAYSLSAKVNDDKENQIASDSGSKISFCFKAPKTGIYTISYNVTGLNGSYSYAITQACLSESNCRP